eukprot:GFUD01009113.1.p1 GENE.GFUD01009113.1~~GFUD01009113.1.p1  ORF type:complete len:434 (-),score=116.96 GFUD01009113.1:49-1350(-)
MTSQLLSWRSTQSTATNQSQGTRLVMTAENDIKDIKMWMDENLVIEEIVVNESKDPDIFLGISGAEFTVQPPSNLRKSNFFNFTIKLYDSSQQQIAIESSTFISFCDEDARNGVQYSVNLLLADRSRVQQRLFVRLVDSASKELVRYENTSRSIQSPELSRVLVTHRAICSRCAEDKICGNKGETPTSPVISNTYELKFFLKCNQNCLKGPGNPRSSRRFQVIVSTTEEMDVLCISQNMFVHNNSKHTKAKSFVNTDDPVAEDPKTFPRILAISPSEGWTMGGQTIVIIGDNFRQGLQVIFGSLPVYSQLISSHAIRVQSPPRSEPGMVEVTLALGCRQYDITIPGMFKYVSPAEPSLDYGFSRLFKLVPRYPGDPPRLSREEVLKRAADLAEAFYSLPVHGMQVETEVELSEDREGDLLIPWQVEVKEQTTI